MALSAPLCFASVGAISGVSALLLGDGLAPAAVMATAAAATFLVASTAARMEQAAKSKRC